ncbi:hypothetical protein JOL62DRAFT_577933 [Phyllosticta paracitricarpa]|uniref:Secreted protein n=1 Tax=Phyllosticta paracitricarpa TaxID=2016321 RepID=A0ABR1N4A6_9PEZI
MAVWVAVTVVLVGAVSAQKGSVAHKDVVTVLVICVMSMVAARGRGSGFYGAVLHRAKRGRNQGERREGARNGRQLGKRVRWGRWD